MPSSGQLFVWLILLRTCIYASNIKKLGSSNISSKIFNDGF